jgi:hypothetical protein
MAWTQQQHDALERAIAEGASSVQYEDRRVTYRSQAEMLSLLAAMKRSLGLTSPRATTAFKSTTDKEL